MVIKNILFYKVLGAILAPALAISLALYFIHAPSFHLALTKDIEQLQPASTETKLHLISELLNNLKNSLIKDPAKKAGYDLKTFSWQRDVFGPITAAIKEILMGSYDEVVMAKVLTSIEVIADEFQNADDPAYNAELATLADTWRNTIYDLLIALQNNLITSATGQKQLGTAAMKKIHARRAIKDKKLPALSNYAAWQQTPSQEPLRPLSESVENQASGNGIADYANRYDNNGYAYDPDLNDSYFDTDGIQDFQENYYEPGSNSADYTTPNRKGLPKANTAANTDTPDTKEDTGGAIHKPTEDKDKKHSSDNGPTFIPNNSQPASDNHSPQEAAAFVRQMQTILNRAERNALLDAKRKTEAVEIYI